MSPPPAVPPAEPPASTGPSPEGSSLQRLRVLLLGEGGLMASLVGASAGDSDGDGDDIEEARGGAQNPAGGSDGDTGFRGSPEGAGPDSNRISAPAQIAASGPRAEGHREDYELLIETIYEGYLLHYGAPRVAFTSDGDLALLAGDRLYALGLARLVALGDIAAVTELADTITLSALSRAAQAPELADAIWVAGARAIGWGSSDAHERAKELVLTGAPEAIEAMRTISDRPPPTLAASP